jgi:hypothetical protein
LRLPGDVPKQVGKKGSGESRIFVMRLMHVKDNDIGVPDYPATRKAQPGRGIGAWSCTKPRETGANQWFRYGG